MRTAPQHYGFANEDDWAAFISKAPRTPEVYARWRGAGIPLLWLVRAGFPVAPVRMRRGHLP